MEDDLKMIEFIAESNLTTFEITSLYTLFFGIDGVVDMFCYQNIIELKYNCTKISKVEMFQFIVDLGVNQEKFKPRKLHDDFFLTLKSSVSNFY
ncbi:hypothetical protein L3073_02155 [Ancylomarina sp. DW003]|nr:hypothetical protein [Ancylomarina sp. DW003]MDE5421005.1 hypothetical protein [Ancylomarina sp. DW003]